MINSGNTDRPFCLLAFCPTAKDLFFKYPLCKNEDNVSIVSPIIKFLKVYEDRLSALAFQTSVDVGISVRNVNSIV